MTASLSWKNSERHSWHWRPNSDRAAAERSAAADEVRAPHEWRGPRSRALVFGGLLWNGKGVSGVEGVMKTLLLLVAGLLLPACRSASPESVFESGVEGGVVGGIGCDVCAIALVIDATTEATDGTPLPAVEVWWVPPAPRLPGDDTETPSGRARRLGITDAEGQLRVPECLMGGSEFRFTPPGPTVRLEFMLFREGYGSTRVLQEVPSGDVLHTGYVLGKPMGDPLKDGYVVTIAEALAEAH
jgi:hypothetical protein